MKSDDRKSPHIREIYTGDIHIFEINVAAVRKALRIPDSAKVVLHYDMEQLDIPKIEQAIASYADRYSRERLSFLSKVMNEILALVANNENERACKKLASLIELL